MPKSGMESNSTRRKVLKSAGGLGATAIGVSAAGCLGDDDEPGDDGDDDSEPSDPDELGPEVPPVVIYSSAPDEAPATYERAQIAMDGIPQVGLEAEIEPMTWTRISDARTNRTHHMATSSHSGAPERLDPTVYLRDYFHSDAASGAAGEPGGRNRDEFIDPEYDELVDSQLSVADRDERQEIVYECQEYLHENVGRIMGYAQSLNWLYNNQRLEDPPAKLGEGLWSFWTVMDPGVKDEYDTVRVGYTSDVNVLNPLNPSAAHDRNTQRLIYDRLARLDGADPQPWLAEDWEAVDGSTWDVTIRDDFEFHDGEPVTVEDVVFTMDFLDEHSPIFSGRTDMMENVEALDDSTVRFELEAPFAPFPNTTLCELFILPKHIWEEIAEEHDNPYEADMQEPIGSGPFEFERWDREVEMELSVNHDHPFTPEGYDRLLHIPYADQTGQDDAIEAGELDIGWSSTTIDTFQRLEEHPDVGTIQMESHGIQSFESNQQLEPLGRLPVRKAISHAIDFELAVETVYDGGATLSYSVIAPPNEFWHNPDTPAYPFDIDAAREILADAGYGWDDDDRLHFPPGTEVGTTHDDVN